MRRLVARLRSALPVACALALAAPAAAAGYEVVLASGARVIATSRPLVAMGKVSFLDEGRRPVSLSSSEVNVQATRERLGSAQPAGKVWDEKALAKTGSRIQFYGGDAPATAPATEDAATPGAPTTPGVQPSPAEALRAQIDGLNSKIRTLPTSDRSESMMVIRQLELQQELTRLLTSPAQRG